MSCHFSEDVIGMSKNSGKLGFDLLSNEVVEVFARPHPLSFLKYYLVNTYLILVALFLNQAYNYIKIYAESNQWIKGLLGLLKFIPWMKPEDLLLLILFWAILILSGLLIGVLWVSKMPLLYMILLGAAGTLLEVYFLAPYETFLFIQKPLVKLYLLALAAIIGFFLIEIYRRGHKYFITNYRIVTIKKFIRKEMREIMYDKITDVYLDQGILGRIFNFGTIIPISASSFGLGEDAALAAVSAGTSSPKKGFLGISFGGKRGVNRPRAATYFSLYGVSNPKKIHLIIANKMIEMKEAPILRRIERLLEEKKGEDKEDLEEND